VVNVGRVQGLFDFRIKHTQR